jgi:hypothetical protein
MASMRAAKVATKPLARVEADTSYEHDFYAWSFEQARALRARRTAALDWRNLAEEVESLGRSIRHAVRSKLTIIVSHLLKLKYQPKKGSSSWLASITTQRADIQALLDESPSLRDQVPEILAETYRTASRVASFEMGWSKREKRMLPDECPFTVEQVLDEEFFLD